MWNTKTTISLWILTILAFCMPAVTIYATPSCQIVTENFSTLADGATVDNRSTGWYLDASQVPNALYFAVKSHRFHAEELGGQGIWYSRVMTVTGKPNFQVGVKITAEGDLTSSEYVKIYYKLNGGAETLMDQRTGNFGTIDFQSGLLNANTVQIVVKLYNYDKATSAKSVYYIEEYRIFSNITGCSLNVSPGVSGSITCATPSVTLSPGTNTTSNVTYRWSGPNGFSSTSQNPIVSISGTYNVTATIAASSSTATGAVTVLQNTTTPGATATASGTLECSAPAVIITGSSATSGATYSWTGPDDFTSNNAVDTIHVAGTYTVTITNPVNGCKSTSSVTVAQGTSAPGASASVSGTLTCTITSVTLLGSSATSGVSYSWSGPNGFTSALQNSPVTTVGTYTLTVSDPATNCTSTATTTVIQNGTLPGATAGVSSPIMCTTDSVTLLGNSLASGETGVTYSWSGPNSFTSTAQNPVVSTTGTYTLTVTNTSTSCQSIATTSVTQNTTAPGASASASGSLNCTTTSVTLSGSSATSGVAYSWSGPNSFTSTAQNPSVTNPGTYTLTVANPTNGCTSTASTTVVQSEALPGASASVSQTLTCSVTSVALSGSSPTSGVTYSWSGPNSFTSTSQNPSVSTVGTYTLTVTNPSNGCTSLATVIVNQNTAAPGATASVSGTLTCDTEVTLLGGSATQGVTYSWTGPGGFTSSLQNPTANTSGTYTLTVTNPVNSCTSSQPVTVDPMTSTSTDFWVEDFTFSNGTKVDNGTTSWSATTPPGTFAVNSNEFIVSGTGTSSEGVWTSGTINISGKTDVAVSVDVRTSGTVMNSTGTYADYLRVYYKLNGGAEILAGQILGSLGSVTTVSSGPVNGTSLQVVIRARATGSDEFYHLDNIKLTGTSTTTDFWFEDFTLANGTTIDNGATSWSRLNPGSGTFSVQSNEFMASFSAANEGVWLSGIVDISAWSNVVVSAYLRSATASTSDYLESDDYIRVYYKLNGEAETLIFGDAAGLNGVNNNSSSATIASSAINGSTLQIVIRARNSSTTERYYFDNVKLTGTPITTGINASASVSGILSCSNLSVTLQGSSTASGLTYSWTGPNSFSSTLQNPTTTIPGSYVLTVSNSSGCSASDIVNVSQNITAPGATTGVSGPITCTLPSVNLTGSSATSGVTYSWAGPNSYTSTAQNPTVNVAGTYTLTVVNPANGCTSSSSVQVTSTAGTTGTVWLENYTLANGTTVDNGSTSWSVNTPPGTFSVQNSEFRVSGTGTSNEAVWTSGSINISGKTNITVSADLRSSGVEMNTTGTYMDYIRVYYKLNGGSEILISEKSGSINNHSTTNTTVSVSSLSGNSLQVVVRGRASGSDEFYYFDNIQVTGTIQLTSTAIANGILGCTIDSVALSGNSNTSGINYSWSGPDSFTSTSQNPSVSTPGTYTLTVTDPSSGCVATDTANVIQSLTAPEVTASVSGSLTCTTTSITLSGGSATSGVTYSWSGPDSFTSTSQNPSINTPGTYTLTVTNPANGCTSTASTNVARDTIAPWVTASVSGTLTCTTTSVTLSGSSITSGVTYSWSGPNSFTSALQNPSVSAAGTYTLTVTNPANGCTSTQTVQVISNTGATGTLWNEEFPHTNGTTSDNGITSWSVTSTTGTFAVYNNEFRVTNTGTSAQGTWTSGLINISGKSNVGVFVDVRSAITGSAIMNTSGTYMDYIRFYYKLNGGSEILFAEKLGAINSHSIYGTTVSIGSLNGTSLQIIVKARASGSDEFYYFDNVKVIGSGQIDASASVSGSLTCTDTTVTLLGNSSVPGVTYNWSGPGIFTSSLQNPSVETPGTYSLTVTDPSNGCYSVVTMDVLQDITAPGASAGVSGQLSCTAALVTLSGSSSTSGVTFNWSGPGGFTSSLQNPTVNILGIYSLTVTNPSNGCTSEASVEVTAAPPSPPTTFWLEDFTFANGTTLDNGTTSWLLQNTGSGTFSVQSNEFMASFSAANEGVWSSGIVNISAKSNVTVSVDLKSATASSSDYLEEDDYICVYYKLDNGPEILMFEDFGGLGNMNNTTATATVTSGYLNASSMQVIVRLRNSHSTERYYFDNVKITGNEQTVGTITTSVSGPITCPNPGVQLSASVTNPSASYYWVSPDNTTINSQNPTVSIPGNYTVVVSVGGCQASKTVNVGGSTLIPDISVSGDHIACATNVPAILNAVTSNTNLAYFWSGPAGFTSTIMNPSVLNAGTYTVTVTDQANLCTNTASYDVQFGTLIWNEEFEGLPDGTIEDLGSTAWSINNSQIHTVDISAYSGESGIPYYFEVRENKLTAKSTRGEVVWTSHPIDISGAGNVFARLDISGEGSLNDLSDCGNDCFDYDYVKVYYKIDGGAETLFENLGSIHGKTALSGVKISSNIPDGNSLQIIVKAYNTGNSEIFYFDNIQVLSLGQGGGQVSASVSGTLTCNDSIVILTAFPNITGNEYTWTGPHGYIFNGPEAEVDQPGTYTLVVIGNTGCVTSDTVSVDVVENVILPDISITSTGVITCTDSIITINSNSSTPGITYSWNGPAGFSSELQNIAVTMPGKYVLTVENTNNGCLNKDSIIIDQDITEPELSISPVDTLSCAIHSVSLNATSSTPNTIFTWSGFGAGINPVTLSVPGTYVVKANNTMNGCTKKDSVTVIRDIAIPDLTIAPVGDLTCKDTTVILDAFSSSPNTTITWNGFMSGENPVEVSVAGIYHVTATNNTNGCIKTDSVGVVTNMQAPVVNVQGDTINCADQVVTISASSGSPGVTYLWSDDGLLGDPTLPELIVFIAGNYTVVVTDTTNGCSSEAIVNVGLDNLEPDLTVIVSDTLSCSVSSVILTAFSSVPDVILNWTDFGSDDSVVINNPGEYTVTAQNPVNGCRVSETVTVFQNTIKPDLSATATGTLLTCEVTSVTLTANTSTPNTFVTWTGFAQGENPVEVTVPDSYVVTAANTVNGCTSRDSIEVSQDINIPDLTIDPAGDLTCSNTTVTLNASSVTPNATFAWNGFAPGVNPLVISNPGTYIVKATNNSNGCTKLDSVAVNQNITVPDLSVDPVSDLTCSNTSVSLHASSATPNVTLTWNGFAPGMNTVNISVPNKYFVTAKDNINGCEKHDSVTVNQNIVIPDLIIDSVDVLTCSDTVVILNASSSVPNVIFAWSGFSSGMNPVEVDEPDKYFVTATDTINGCTRTDSVIVSQDIAEPDLTIDPVDILTILNPTVPLHASSATPNVTITWTGFAVGENPVTVSFPGKYYVVATNNTIGCTKLDSVVVTQNITLPDLAIGLPDTLTCIDTSVVLVASSTTPNTTVTWTGFPEGQNSITVSEPGNYVVSAINNITGSSTVDSVTVSQDTIHPIFSIAPLGTLTCITTSVGLQASSATPNTTFTWTGFGAGQNPVFVSEPDTYEVTATNSTNGCANSSLINVVENTTLPGVTVSSPGILTCDSTFVALSANSSTTGVTYSWTGPGDYNSSAQNIQTSIPGKYKIVVTDPVNGCTSSDSLFVQKDTIAPAGVSANVSGTLTCSVTSVNLMGSSATSNVTYYWTGPDEFESTDQDPETAIPGLYTLSVRNPVNGCLAYDSEEVGQNTVKPQDVAAVKSGDITCTDTIVDLSGTSTTPDVLYHWTGPGMDSLKQSVSVGFAGLYSITVTDTLNGCFVGKVVQVLLDDDKPTGISTSVSGVLTCTLTSVSVFASSATPNVVYSWVGPGGFTSGIQSPLVDTAGNYTVTITNTSNGCFEKRTVPVLQNIALPQDIRAGVSGILTCNNPTRFLSGASTTTGATYSWTGPGEFSSSLPSPFISLPGDYLLVVTHPTSFCTDSIVVSVSQDIVQPADVDASVSGPLTCDHTTVSLLAASSTTGVSYLWTGPNGFTSISQEPTISDSGFYKLKVTNTGNGCIAKDSVLVAKNMQIPDVSALGATITCAEQIVTITASSTTPNVTYQWSNGGLFGNPDTSELSVFIAGDYTITVADPINGCTNTETVTVELDDAKPDLSVTLSSDSLTCSVTTVTLTASSSVANVIFTWTGLEGDSSVTVSNPGIYTVTAQNPANGCSEEESVTVYQDTVPPALTVSSSSTLLTCDVTSITLTAGSTTPNTSLTWTGFAVNENPINIQTPGTYYVTAQRGSNGCIRVDSVVVTQNVEVPDLTTTGGTITCSDQFIMISASSTASVTYLWSDGGLFGDPTAPELFVFLAGDYSVAVASTENGCSNSDTVTVSLNTEPPVCNIIAPQSAPVALQNNTISAQVLSGVTYSWSVSGTGWSIVSGQSTSEFTYKAGAAGTSGTILLTLLDNGNGCSSECSIVLTAVNLSSAFEIGQSNAEGDMRINVYPNPFSNEAWVEITPEEEDTYVTVELYSLNGILQEKLFEGGALLSTTYKVAINGDKMANGTYYVIVRTNKDIVRRNLILLK